MEKLAALWSLFRVGESVSDPVAWKTRQVTATVLAGVLVAAVRVLRAFGVEVPVDQADLEAVAAGVLVVVNVVLTYATTDRIGLLPAKAGIGDSGGTRPTGG